MLEYSVYFNFIQVLINHPYLTDKKRYARQKYFAVEKKLYQYSFQ